MSGLSASGAIGVPIKVYQSLPRRISFTSTGMKEMSAIQYKRQGDKFQVFIALSDKYNNILKNYSQYLWSPSFSQDHTFHVTWESGGDSHTSNISSISTNKFPYNTSTGKTELSSFLYVNIDPLSAGTWTMVVSSKIPSLSTDPNPTFSKDYDNGIGPEGNVSLNGSTNMIDGSYTFTISPSTNDVQIYKINEDIDYSQVLKSYRFQSFMHEYDKLFDGIFTSFVGQASSSPTTFGKTIFEKTANFVLNNSDIDFCKIENIQAFYDFFNEDIDFVSPTPPPELKRLYDLFSIKISKLLGEYDRVQDNFSTQYYTSSAASRNIDLTSKITASTYTVSAGTNFVARQRFNDEFILIKPQKVPTKHVDGSSSGESSTYDLSSYNVYSNWGWPLDTSVSGASGLDTFYDFYPYTTYDMTSSTENIKNNIIDFENQYTSITRATSSLSGSWENTGGIIYKNIDYQIRKGLSL